MSCALFISVSPLTSSPLSLQNITKLNYYSIFTSFKAFTWELPTFYEKLDFNGTGLNFFFPNKSKASKLNS